MKISAIRTAILRVVGPCVFVKIDTDNYDSDLKKFQAAPILLSITTHLTFPLP